MAGCTPVKVAYKVFNPASGADEKLSPIIFLHGMTGSKDMWEDMPQIIADRTKRKTYAIDARNHGDSVHTENFNFDVNVDDLLHFMDNMHISKAVLVGHSMGGRTAAYTALRKPERVEMLFSEDMFIKRVPQEILDPLIEFITGWTQIVRKVPPHLDEKDALKFAIDTMISKVPKEMEGMVRKEQMDKIKFDLKRDSDGKYDVKFNKDAIIREIHHADTLMCEPSGQYNGPAYFIYGSLSPMQVNKDEDNIRKHFPNGELIKFEDATHNVHGEFPEKYINTILQRLQ